MIEPPNEFFEEYVFDRDADTDRSGIWPMYIYNYGLKCDETEYKLFIHVIDDNTKNPLESNSTCKENKYYKSIHHTFDDVTKKFIYNLYS